MGDTIDRGPMNRMSAPGTPPRTLKTNYFDNLFGALWMYQALGDMLSIIVSSSNFGKLSIATETNTFGSHVDAQSVNSYR